MAHRETTTDILIVGGGTGGVAAALAVARAGLNCILVEWTDWIGGQLTAQGVPPDENRWIEGGEDGTVQGATRSYLDFRKRVRQWYRDNRPLKPDARANPRLNPGNGWVSHLCFEPKIGHEILQQMLAEHVAAKRIRIWLNDELTRVETEGDCIRSVSFRYKVMPLDSATVRAKYVLDATECGDVLAMANVESSIGAEAKSVHGELHARADKTDPFDQQAVSWCFALEHRDGENWTIDKPANYSFWRDYIPPLDVPWPGKLFSWTVVGGDEHKPRTFPFIPYPDAPREDEWEMWRYRRITDASIYEEPGEFNVFTDVALINMVQMDYFLKPTLGVSDAERKKALEQAREQSLCFLYWMQTEAPRHDSATATGYAGLKLRGDELGTADGFAKHPYIRESRRLLAKTIVTESHVGVEQRKSEARPEGSEPFADSVGIGHYRLDLHPSTAMRNSIYVHASPFRIPLGALIPIRMRNVLAAGKNLGVTHVTNGCYRLHPVEWNVGESAGALAAHCVQNNLEPHQIHEKMNRVRDFQKSLINQGIALAWPWENGANL